MAFFWKIIDMFVQKFQALLFDEDCQEVCFFELHKVIFFYVFVSFWFV